MFFLDIEHLAFIRTSNSAYETKEKSQTKLFTKKNI